MPRRFFSCGVGQGPVLHPASYRQVCRHGRTLGSGPGEEGAETSAKGTLRPASCWLSPLTLLCVHSGAAARGHPPVVQPALSRLCCGGPVAPVCTRRASVTAPSPGRWHHQWSAGPWEGCVAQEQMWGGLPGRAPQPLPSPRGASGTPAGHRTATELLTPTQPLLHLPPREVGGACCQARLQGHLGLHGHSAAGSHGLAGIAASPGQACVGRRLFRVGGTAQFLSAFGGAFGLFLCGNVQS